MGTPKKIKNCEKMKGEKKSGKKSIKCSSNPPDATQKVRKSTDNQAKKNKEKRSAQSQRSKLAADAT